MKKVKTVKFFTLGCKVNQYDTQKIREELLSLGLKEAENEKPADLCLVNTCTVTHRADADSLQALRRLTRFNPGAGIIVTGCLAQLDAERINAVNGKVLIVKNKDKQRISEIVGEFFKIEKQAGCKTFGEGIRFFKGRTRAFLKVQDGCNNFCAYCKVPLVRGRSVSRPPDTVIREARALAENGFKEIVLTGICLGAYGRDLRPKSSLAKLIGKLEDVEGLLRIRLSSIEAADVDETLIKAMAASKKLCPHLHIPIQSGDDRILELMRRRYRSRDYLGLIKRIRLKIPQIAITTDCLVGFPGESRDNFLNTLKLVKQIKPLRTHIFPYSPRQGTVAYGLSSPVNPAVIRERMGILKTLSDKCSREFKEKFLGKKIEVLAENRVKGNPEFWQGHSGNYLEVCFKSSADLHNQIVTVRLQELRGEKIFGKLIC